MGSNILTALINNAALLLVLSIIYEVTYLVPYEYRRIRQIFSGLMVTLVCIAIMSMPFTLRFGMIFDTRSILISVTALIFGLIPTFITVAAATIVRLIIGGAGTIPGIAVIITSALIGLVWRRRIYPKSTKWSWLNVYAMGVGVHIIMLACMFLLPYPKSLDVIREMAVPVLVVYPIVTVLLSMLLIHQQDLRLTQVQLKQSEERFKLLFEKAPLGYQSLDIEGYFVDVNRQWCDLLGYSRDEVVGKWFGDFLSPENREAFLERFPIFKMQGYIHSEFELLHKNGQPLFISFEGKIGYGINGEFKQTHCILQDITGQKAAEAALAESEKKYRDIAENMSDVVWQVDLNLKITYVSLSVEKLLGESPEEHKKRTLKDKFPEPTLNRISTLFVEEMEKEKDLAIDKNRSQTIEVEHYKVDGTLIWIDMNISIMRDMRGTAVGFLGVSRDITQRKLTEQALKESERSKSVLLSNIPGMAYRCNYDVDWTMQFVSAGCFELTGYTSESLIDNKELSFNELITLQFREPLWKEWERVLSNRLPFKYEYEITTSGGEQKWVLELGEGIYDEKGNVEALEGIIIDITERKELEHELKYRNEHDYWTGLHNLRYLESVLKRDGVMQKSGNRAVISINLSSINLISMTYGFIYSQGLINNAADRLKHHCSDDRQLFHTHENRFAFYLKAYSDKDELTAFCEDVANTLEVTLPAKESAVA